MSLIWRSYDTYMIITWYLNMCSVTWTWCFKMFHDPAPKRLLTASDGIWIWWPHVTPWYQHFMTVTLSVMSVWCLKLTKLDMKYGAQNNHTHTHISNLQNACIAPTKWGFLAQNSAVLVFFETCSEIAPVPLGALLDGQTDCWLFKRDDFPLSLCHALCQFMNSRQAFTQKQLSDSCRCHLFSVSCGLEIFRNLPKWIVSWTSHDHKNWPSFASSWLPWCCETSTTGKRWTRHSTT